MHIRGIKFEDFINYKIPSMFIITCYCDWKCCNEAGISNNVCQNEPLMKSEIKEYDNETIIKAYKNNYISQSVVIGGLEPLLQFDELLNFIEQFREAESKDPIVIYTGYNKEEISGQIEQLKQFSNIIVKFGRYVPDKDKRFDETLGVYLASDNQYAEKIS